MALPTMATTSMATNTADQTSLCQADMVCDGLCVGYTQSCSRSLASVRRDMVRSGEFSTSPSRASRPVELCRDSASVVNPNSTDNTITVQLLNRPSSMRDVESIGTAGRGRPSVVRLQKTRRSVGWKRRPVRRSTAWKSRSRYPGGRGEPINQKGYGMGRRPADRRHNFYGP